jgi:ABC-type multidrug transport system ATPase subunit
MFGGRWVIAPLTRRFEPGTVVGIIGPNGSGKSTLLRLIAGILMPTSGSVTVDGRPAGRGRTAFVPSGDRGLNWRLTGRQNLAFYARVGWQALGDVDERVKQAASATGAGDLLETRAGVCSMGQRRRLMIAAGIVLGSPVMMIDEPFADLDEVGIEFVSDVLLGWARRGGLSLFAAPSAADGPKADEEILLAEDGLAGD